MKLGGFVTYGFATIAWTIAIRKDNLVFASSSLDKRTDPSLFKVRQWNKMCHLSWSAWN